MRTLHLALLVVVVAVGCERQRGEAPTPPAEPAEAPASAEAPAPAADPAGLTDHMREHADRADAAREALIRGDLEATRAPLRWLGSHPEPEPFPGVWRDQIGSMQAAARAAAAAPDLEATAAAMADLSRRCAVCHAALDRGPAVPLDAPPAGDDLSDHMQRHAWAMRRMWEGLIAASPGMYRRGALALVEAPVHGAGTPDQEFPTSITGLAARVHTLGLAAHDSEDPAEQARLYGELAGTCARCHDAVDAF